MANDEMVRIILKSLLDDLENNATDWREVKLRLIEALRWALDSVVPTDCGGSDGDT